MRYILLGIVMQEAVLFKSKFKFVRERVCSHNMKNQVFGSVTPCWLLSNYGYFEGALYKPITIYQWSLSSLM
jgi:hypothetical protein